jgi:hypothetical protein
VYDVEASPAFTVSPARPAATPEMDALLEPGLCLGSRHSGSGAHAADVAVGAELRNLPREQVSDMAIQRLRAALPKGTTITEPKGIQFPLVPVPPPGDKR